MEFEDLYPKEPPYQAGTLEDIQGKPLRDTWLVGDHLRNDDRMFVYPKHYEASDAESKLFCSPKVIPYIIDPKDLISTIKNAHYSALAKLSKT